MMDKTATRALVLGLLSLPFGVLSPVAIWTGGRSLFRIRTSRGEIRGARSAATGLIAGFVGLTTSILGTAYWFASS